MCTNTLQSFGNVEMSVGAPMAPGENWPQALINEQNE